MKTQSDLPIFSEMFHGSSKKLKTIKPQKHSLIPNRKVVFGTPTPDIALVFLQPWDDSMLEFGIVGDDPPYLIKMFSGAFKSIFGGKAGYVYQLDPNTFTTHPNLANFKAVSYKSPKIIHTYKVDDTLKALKASNITMVLYKDAKRFRQNYFM